MLFEDGTGFCPWHEKDSSFKVVTSTTYVSPYYYSLRPEAPKSLAKRRDSPINTGIVVMECLHCGKSVILLETTVRVPSPEVGGEDSQERWRTMVAPAESPRELHKSAPRALRSLYEEASKCERAGALRAAAVMYRAAVETIVNAQGAAGQGLKAKIKSLNGKLPHELVQDLHEARMMGDDSIHAGITYSRDEVEDVAQLIEEAVLVLYVQPEQKRAMREARKARRNAAKNTGH